MAIGLPDSSPHQTSCRNLRIMVDFIVSLTTHRPRIFLLPTVLENIQSQTLKPSKVVINIAEISLISKGFISKYAKELKLEVNVVPDLGPATKLIPTLARFPDLPIVTIDDDVAYRSTLFQELVDAHEEHPGLKVASLARELPPTRRPWLIPYLLWPKIKSEKTTELHNVLPLGAEGVLYPPHYFAQEVFDIDALKECCWGTDDLWFWAHPNDPSRPTLVLEHRPESSRHAGSQGSGLWRRNRFGRNNLNLRKILRRFPQVTYALRSRLRLNYVLAILGHIRRETKRKGPVQAGPSR